MYRQDQPEALGGSKTPPKHREIISSYWHYPKMEKFRYGIIGSWSSSGPPSHLNLKIIPASSDVNNDWTCKDTDKDQAYKDQDKD